MENPAPGKSMGYQKRVKQAAPGPARKAPQQTDYASPLAKKWPQMREALEKGNADVVRSLIDEGMNINILRDGVTPLMIAASKGHVDIASMLLEAGANINARSESGKTALHLSAEQSGTAVVDLLVHSGIDPDAKDASGRTALDIAKERRSKDVIQIIQKHQNQMKSDEEEWAHFLASEEGKPYNKKHTLESLEALLPFWWLPLAGFGVVGVVAGWFLNALIVSTVVALTLGTAAGAAVYYWIVLLRKYLDEIGPLPELDIQTLRRKRHAGETILVPKRNVEDSAASMPSESDDGSRINTSAKSRLSMPRISPQWVLPASIGLAVLALAVSSWLYRGELAKWYVTGKLERKGIPVTNESFLAAVAGNDGEAVDLFIRTGISADTKNTKGQTALMIAAGNGHAGMAEKLLALKPEQLNQVDADGSTPLTIAARNGHQDVVALLVEKGAEVNASAGNGIFASPALLAALTAPEFKEVHLKTVQFLLSRGADTRGQGAYGSPLVIASGLGHREAVRALLDAGADLNEIDNQGNFPLMAAAIAGRAEVISLLADKGANMRLASPKGDTPLICAAREGSVAVMQTLIARGAPINVQAGGGGTALSEACAGGKVEAVRVLLDQGADPGVFVPTGLAAAQAKSIAVKIANRPLGDVLKSISAAAAKDGYSLITEPNLARKVAIKMSGPWNRVLIDVARKNNLVLVLRNKDIAVLAFDPTRIKRESK